MSLTVREETILVVRRLGRDLGFQRNKRRLESRSTANRSLKTHGLPWNRKRRRLDRVDEISHPVVNLAAMRTKTFSTPSGVSVEKQRHHACPVNLIDGSFSLEQLPVARRRERNIHFAFQSGTYSGCLTTCLHRDYKECRISGNSLIGRHPHRTLRCRPYPAATIGSSNGRMHEGRFNCTPSLCNLNLSMPTGDG